MSTEVSVDYNNLASYDNICGNIRPFDLIAFRGGDVISDLISTLESYRLGLGTFSHVGMAVTSEILSFYNKNGEKIYLSPGRIYVFESTISYNVPDITTGRGKLGVQIRDLEEVIPSYITSENTHVAWCKLLHNPFDRIDNESDISLNARRNIISERFQELFFQYEGCMYEMDLISLLGGMFPSIRGARTIRDKIYNKLYSVLYFCGITKKENIGPAGWQFCSELVANIYQSFDIIPDTCNPKDVLPIDFFGCDEDGLPLLVESPVFIKDWVIPNLSSARFPSNNNDVITKRPRLKIAFLE